MTTSIQRLVPDRVRARLYTPVDAIYREFEYSAREGILREAGRVLAVKEAALLAVECNNVLPALRERVAEAEARLPALQAEIDAAQIAVAKALQEHKAALGKRNEKLAEHAVELARQALAQAEVAKKFADNDVAAAQGMLQAVEELGRKLASFPEPDLSPLVALLRAVDGGKRR